MTTVRELVIKVNFEGNAKEESKSLVGGLADVKAGFDLLVSAGKVAAQAIASFTTDIASAGDEIAKTATNLGISAEALQEMAFVSKIAGSDVNTFATSIQRMGKGINDAREKGTGPFADSLDQLGIKLSDLDGLSPDETFTELADAISRVEDPMTKAALAQDLFGRGGKTLLPLINEGRKGIEKLRKEFKMLGGGFTNDGAKAAEEFQDAMLRMETVIDSVKIAVGVELLPVIQEIIDEIRVWANDNREAVTEELVDFVSDLTGALKKMGPTLKTVLPLIEDFAIFTAEAIAETGFLIEHIEELDELLTEDFGPAWTAIKVIMDAALEPFRDMSDAFDDLTTGSDKLGGSLGVMLGPLKSLISLTRQLTGAGVPGEGEQSFRGVGAGQVQVFEGEGFASDTAEQAAKDKGSIQGEVDRVDNAKTNSELSSLANDKSLRPTTRVRAQERLRQAEEDDLAFVESFIASNVEAAKGDPTRGRRRKGKGKKKESEKVKAEELQKLISVAAEEGIGLEGVLGGREIEGGTPPVISVIVNNNDQKINVAVDLTVNGVPGEVAEDVAQRVIGQFEDLLSVEFRDAMEEATPRESR